MVQRTLERIEGTTYKATLEKKKSDRKRLAKMGAITDAHSIELSLAGYIQALRDVGVITERERQELFIYYATI